MTINARKTLFLHKIEVGFLGSKKKSEKSRIVPKKNQRGPLVSPLHLQALKNSV